MSRTDRICWSKRTVVLGGLLLGFLMAPPAFGSTVTVTHTNDSGPGSLRDAIATSAPGDTIDFGVTGTITLSSTLVIDKDLTISGPGAASLSVSGNNSIVVFVTAYNTNVTISGLTVTRGFNADRGGWGGGIVNRGSMTVSNCVITGNTIPAGGGPGGGIFNYSSLKLINSIVSGNSAAYGGGGVWNNGNARLEITGSTISGNSAVGDGGGVSNVNGVMTITRSLISGNSSQSSGGGLSNIGTLTLVDSTVSGNSNNGIFNWGGSTLKITGSTISGNTSVGWGGGINSWGTLTIANSTFASNAAATGGGILHYAGVMKVSNSTFSGNRAQTGGGGLWTSSTVTLKSTVMADSGAGGNCGSDRAAGTSAGHNLSDDNSCSSFFIQPGDLNSTPAGLDPAGLQDNGGATKTFALMSSSPALDAIPVSACTDVNSLAVATDQRGISRPQGSACDMGSLETLAHSDTTAPVVTGRLTPAPNGAGWNNTNVAIAWSASDPESDITSGPTPASATASVDGAGQSFSATATNGASLVGEGSVTVNLDKTKPAIIAEGFAGTQGSNGWYTSNVTVRFVCSDATSGVAHCPSDQALTSQGVNMSSAQTATDVAGNSSDASNTVSVNIDSVNPALSITGVTDGGVYTVGQVNPGIQCTDATSGVESSSGNLTGGNPNGLGTFTYSAVCADKAGNLSRHSATFGVVPVNASPVAEACCDVFVNRWRSKVVLDGSGSLDPEGAALTYAWTMVRGPVSVSPLQQPTSAGPSFVFEALGTYVFELVVSDGVATSTPSRVTVRWTGFDELPLLTSFMGWDPQRGMFQADYGLAFRDGAASSICSTLEGVLGSDVLGSIIDPHVGRVVDPAQLERLQAALGEGHKYVGIAYSTICKGLRLPLPPPDCNMARDFFKRLTGKTPEEMIIEPLPLSPAFKSLILSRLNLCPLGFNTSDLSCSEMVDVGQELARLTVPGLGALLATPGVAAVLKSFLCEDWDIDLDLDIDFTDWEMPRWDFGGGGSGGGCWPFCGSGGGGGGGPVCWEWRGWIPIPVACSSGGGGSNTGSGGGEWGEFFRIGAPWWDKLPEPSRSLLGGVDCSIVPPAWQDMTIGTLFEYAAGRNVSSTRVLNSVMACGATYVVSGFPSALADLSVTIGGPAAAIAGETGQYVATVRNLGPATAAATLTLPVATGAMLTIVSGATGSCVTYPAHIACVFAAVPPGESRTVAITAAFTIPQQLYFRASVVGLAADPRLSDNAAEHSVLVRARPLVSWVPQPLVYGTPVGAGQLNASAPVAGQFEYSIGGGTILAAGTHSISVTFVPSDGTRYVSVVREAAVHVMAATPTLSVADARIVFDGSPHGVPASAVGVFGEQLSPVIITYGGSASAPTDAGTYAVTARFLGSSNYTPAEGRATLSIERRPSTVTWSAPEPIVVGTPLGATHLRASADVPGRFVYVPAADTVLPVGRHDLSVRFVPDDERNHMPSDAIVSVVVTYAVCDVDGKIAEGVTSVILSICAADGANRSAGDIAVRAVSLVGEDGNEVPLRVLGAHQETSELAFNRGLRHYTVRLDSKDLSQGRYRLRISIMGDPLLHDMIVMIR